MFIISKKKDYYDGVVGTVGIDKTLVYNRETVEIEENKFPNILKKMPYYWGGDKNTPFTRIGNFSFIKGYQGKYQVADNFIIGFCGKLYVGWKLSYEVDAPQGKVLMSDITYDFEFIKSIFNCDGWSGKLIDQYNYVVSYDALQLFIDLKVPVFIYEVYHNRTSIGKYWGRDTTKFFVNPTLKDYEFFKIFDSFQAFQEIQMFMGGVLGRGEKEIVEIEDKYKIAQHGFNKWSFRKEPKTK